MKYLLGIDFGGGASKATLLSEDGRIAAECTEEYPTLHPALGFCEQDPHDWEAALWRNLKALLEKSGVSPEDIAAVAIDSATHTALLCDANGKPLRNAIHWTDCRATAESAYLRESFGARIFELTYHRPDTIWTMPQLLWVREHEPPVFSRSGRIFFEKDYLRYLLTGVFCTDHIEAAGSMLYDCGRGEWSKELCDMIGLPVSTLPPLVQPTDVIGSVTAEAAEKSGLARGTPVICGTTDTVMEVFASGAVDAGDTTVKLATAGRICVITDRAYPNRHLVNYPHVVKGLWYPGSATKAAASSFRWYRDTFGGDYRELDASAAEVPVGSEGLVYHPYINGELTPYADPALCGSFVGIRSTHTKGHFTRSVLEGVAYSLLHSKRTLEEIGICPAQRATLIGGGAKSKLWAGITADCLGMELTITESSDSSLGSAMLAGVAVGVFASPRAAVNKCIKPISVVKPNLENTSRYAQLFEEYVRIHDALAPIYGGRA